MLLLCFPLVAQQSASLLSRTEFIQNWKTPSTKGKCYVVRVTTIDGSYIQALFKTK